MAEKKNNAWRPKKYDSNERPLHFGSGIPQHFIETFNRFQKLAQVDENDDLKKYCQNVEGIDFDKLGAGKQSVYLRWIVTRHIIQNFYKLKDK